MSAFLRGFAFAILAASVAPHGAWAQGTPPPPAPRRNIAGPGDYDIRDRLVRALTRDAEINQERFTVLVVNGGAVFSGTIGTCAAKQRALWMAAGIRGIINVTDEMTVRGADLSDRQLREAAADRLKDVSGEIGGADLKVEVQDGVATLTGTVKTFTGRARAEGAVGAVAGITRVVNRLRPADAPAGRDDTSIATAVRNYLGDFRQYAFPAEIEIAVKGGQVTLSGRAGLYLARQVAGTMTALVGGVTGVDNRLKVDLSLGPVKTQVKVKA
jgi:osmotically-inducible protein OsmY